MGVDLLIGERGLATVDHTHLFVAIAVPPEVVVQPALVAGSFDAGMCDEESGAHAMLIE
jgi:hypothetical protein